MQHSRSSKFSAASGSSWKSKPPPWSSNRSKDKALNVDHGQQNRKRPRPSTVEEKQSRKVPPKAASPIHQIVTDINCELVKRGLPKWLVEAADKDVKRRAEYRGEYEDMLNIPGSCLVLGMLIPDQFGIKAPQLLPLIKAKEELTFISSAKPKSGKGIDNRRTNCLEALINELRQGDDLKEMLQCAWQMAYRACYLLEHDDRVEDQYVLAQRMFACTEPLDSDEWWYQTKRNLDKRFAETQKVEVEEELQQEAHTIFDRILPQILDANASGEEITYKLLAIAAGFDSHKGKTVRRLFALWMNYCEQYDECAENSRTHDCDRPSMGKNQNTKPLKGSVGFAPAPVSLDRAPAPVSIDRAPLVIPSSEMPHPKVARGAIGEASELNNLENAVSIAASDRGDQLFMKLIRALDAEGFIVSDLPTGDELTAVLVEFGFTAIQRMHLRQMIGEANASDKEADGCSDSG